MRAFFLLLSLLASNARAACPIFADHFEPFEPGGLTFDTSGGYRVTINRDVVTVSDPARKNMVAYWGATHENLNGLHIKDWGGAPGWDGARRTLELGDGTKVTMAADAAGEAPTATTVYDLAEYVVFDHCRNVVVQRGTGATATAQHDAARHDGEIASFTTDAATGVARYDNLGNESASFQYVPTPRALGTTGGNAQPTRVDDFFDDPRLGHT